MKVIVIKKANGRYDCRVQNTRRSEGATVRAKGLTREQLTSYVEEQVKAIEPLPLPIPNGS